jgi:hypothetical protein
MTNRTIYAETPREAFEIVVSRIFTDPGFIDYKSTELPTHIASLGWFTRDLTIHIKHTAADEWNLPITWLGYKFPLRWYKLLREYLTAEALKGFDGQVQKMKRPKAKRSPSEVALHFGADVRRRYSGGPCLSTISYGPWPYPRFALTSRASDFFTIGPLDLAMAGSLIHRYHPEGTPLRWNISLLRISMFGLLSWQQSFATPDPYPELQQMIDKAEHWLNGGYPSKGPWLLRNWQRRFSNKDPEPKVVLPDINGYFARSKQDVALVEGEIASWYAEEEETEDEQV